MARAARLPLLSPPAYAVLFALAAVETLQPQAGLPMLLVAGGGMGPPGGVSAGGLLQ